MNLIEKELVTEIGLILLRLIPGGGFAAGAAPSTLRAAVNLGLSRSDATTIQRIATRIVKTLQVQGATDAKDPGPAIQAALMFASTIRDADLSIAKLLQLDLDSDAVAAYLVAEYPASGYEQASAKRRGLYERAVSTFSARIVVAALDLSGSRAVVACHVLRRQASMERKLDQILASLSSPGP